MAIDPDDLICDCPDYTGEVASNPTAANTSELIDRDWRDSPRWNQLDKRGRRCWHIWNVIITEGLLDAAGGAPTDEVLPADVRSLPQRFVRKVQDNPRYGDYVGFAD